MASPTKTIEAVPGIRMKIDICRWRLAGQFLTRPGPKRGVDVVRALGAVQAQDYSGAKWGVGQRTRGATDASIERELESGNLLRTHILRPTWHLVAATDIRWMLALTSPRVTAAMAPSNRRLELDRALFRRANAVFAKALARQRSLTRAELAEELARHGIGTVSGQRLGHLMMQAELDGVLCSGPRRGKQFTYALLDERAPAASSLERDEALRELARRYFITRGPATPRDFAWWSGLTVADAKRGIEMNGETLQHATVNDVSYWMRADAERPPPATGTAYLLPNYDEYFIGFRDRQAIGNRLRDTWLVTGGNALIPHVVVVDGQLVGTWKRSVEKGELHVTLRGLTRLTRAESARVRAAAEKLGTFLDLTARASLT
ncbi:MAG: winged helix DNA-binding domain-containing protein [Gemmatimonadaceae bacterium]